MPYLPEIDLIKVHSRTLNEKRKEYTFEPLLTGYAQTLGNAFRRTLLSSLKGAAITAVKINDITHEFSAIDGVKEDAVEIILNLKSVRIKYQNEAPTLIKLSAKGPKKICAKDFTLPSGLEIANPDHIIAHVDKGEILNIEAQVESGNGYVPTEKLNREDLPIDMIAIDAIFTPIKKINYEVAYTRVGKITNYDKLILDIETDGTIMPDSALSDAISILDQYLVNISSQIKIPAAITKDSRSKKNSNAN